MEKLHYRAQSSGIYPKYARLAQHSKIINLSYQQDNEEKSHDHTNRSRKEYDKI